MAKCLNFFLTRNETFNQWSEPWDEEPCKETPIKDFNNHSLFVDFFVPLVSTLLNTVSLSCAIFHFLVHYWCEFFHYPLWRIRFHLPEYFSVLKDLIQHWGKGTLLIMSIFRWNLSSFNFLVMWYQLMGNLSKLFWVISGR